MTISDSNKYGMSIANSELGIIGESALESSSVSSAYALAKLLTTKNSSTVMNRKRSASYSAMTDEFSEQKQQKMQEKTNGAGKGIYNQNFKRRGK